MLKCPTVSFQCRNPIRMMSISLIVVLFLSSAFLIDFEKVQGLTLNQSAEEDRHRHGHNKRSVVSDDGIVSTDQHKQKLAYSLSLDPDSNFRLSWTPDFVKEEIQFRVDISQSPPQSWFALGFSDRGDWTGADLCIGWEDWKGSFIVQVKSFDFKVYILIV